MGLQKTMSAYGRLEYSHTGDRLHAERDPPWVLFATTGMAQDAMNAITAGLIMDGNGGPIKAEWKSIVEKGDKGKGKGKVDPLEFSSRDMYRKGDGRGQDRRGGRDDHRRGRHSTSSSSSSRS